MKQVTKVIFGNNMTYGTVTTLDEMLTLVLSDKTVFVDSADFSEENIRDFCKKAGIKVEIARNEAKPCTDYHVWKKGVSVRAAMIAHFESASRGKATIDLSKTPVQVNTCYVTAYKEAKKRGLQVKCTNHWSHFDIEWRPASEAKEITPRKYVRMIIEELATQHKWDIPEMYLTNPKVNQMISNELSNSKLLVNRENGVAIKKYKAQVRMYKGNIYLCVDTKANRVMELERSSSVKELDYRDKEKVINWMKENIPNFLDFLFWSNTIEYTQVEFNNPPPSLPRLEQ